MKIEARTRLELEASAEAAWRLLGEGFGSWSEWTEDMLQSHLEGPLEPGVVRVTEVKGMGRIEQELSHFDPASRSLTYALGVGLPKPIRAARSSWSIEELPGGRCALLGHTCFELSRWAWPLRPVVATRLRSSLDRFAQDLARQLGREAQ